MISHKHKCIFIHIPRCAGTSMEKAIYGKNWFDTRGGGKTKHLIASTAKHLYAPYWKEYFKFSFVRNPWERMVSLAKYPGLYGVNLRGGRIDLSQYIKKFSPIEIDSRSKSVLGDFNPIKNAVYLNILDEELDFVGKFENLQEDFNIVCDSIGLPFAPLENDKQHAFNHQPYPEYYDADTTELVRELYSKDIDYFGYKFEE